MPRSGGGGSHSSGSHSSSHSRSSSSSSSRSHSGGGGSHSSGTHTGSSSGSASYRSTAGIRRRGATSAYYFPGASRYVYRDKKGVEHSFYSAQAVKKPSKLRLTLTLLWVFFLGIMAIAFFSISKEPPKKISAAPAPAAILDEAQIFTDAEGARQTLQAFTDKTGITACIVSLHNETWTPYYHDLETCAYEYYINIFNNEDSLLILYSQPKTVDPAFNDWHFEIMYGDNTVKLLTDSRITALREGIQKGLLQRTGKPEIAISEAVAGMGEGIMDPATDYLAIILGLASLVWGGLAPAQSDPALSAADAGVHRRQGHRRQQREHAGAALHLLRLALCGGKREQVPELRRARAAHRGRDPGADRARRAVKPARQCPDQNTRSAFP